MKHIHIDVCDSTQDVVKEQLNQHQSHDHILVSCDNQLKGRGRGNNDWIVMPGTLSFSLTVDPHPITSFTAIELSVLVARYFEDRHRISLLLKWPNDLWNEKGQKCCGILIQSFHNTMVAGIGLNLFSDHEVFGGIFPANFEIDKGQWSLEIANYISSHRYLDTELLKMEWENRCAHLRKEVVISEGSENHSGMFVGLGVNGEALIETSSSILSLYNGSLRIKS